MRINYLKIRNWRSIKEIQLCPGGLTALVGPNNSGKTNILSALNFLLGDRYPQSQSLEDKDFFNKNRKDAFEIKVEFERGEQIEGLSFALPTYGRERELTAQYKGGRVSGATNDARRSCGFVYLDAGRNFDLQFGSSKWSLFGQIVRRLNDDFQEKVPKERIQEIQGHLERAQELLKTELYQSFVQAVAESFKEQVRLTDHSVQFDFRTFDPLNFYRALYPTLLEDGTGKNPAEAGSGMRNLIVMALFRAYAKTFRSDAIIAVEEPELYLHPHAQRSLAALFLELAENGAQVFYSTHSAAFVSAARFDDVVLVDRPEDDDFDKATSVRHLTEKELLERRGRLHRSINFTSQAVRDRLRFACGIEQAEAFFGRAVVLVEGPTEKVALPIYAAAMGINFDALGVSVVEASGKEGIDLLHDLYDGMGIPVFVMFDNDRHKNDLGSMRTNGALTRLLGMTECDMPLQAVGERFCIFDKNFESAIEVDLEEIEPGLYANMHREAAAIFGAKRKPAVARHIAERLVVRSIIPDTVAQAVTSIGRLVGHLVERISSDIDENEIPF